MTASLKLNSNYLIPFKTDAVIKSEWNHAIWNRRQVRILASPSEEFPSRLIIQEIAQSSLAWAINKFLKFLTGAKLRCLDKYVKLLTIENTILQDFVIPISLEKRDAIMLIQRNHIIGKAHEIIGRLAKLGSKLFEEAALETQEKKIKAMEINLEILNIIELINEMDHLSLEDCLKNYQTFKMLADQKFKMCSGQPLSAPCL